MEQEAIDEVPRQRLRILYSKGEAIQFISHQDEFRMWERTLRRADLPLVYKQGFNPQPMIQFAAPLAVGMTGMREYLDVTLAPPAPVLEVIARLRAALPVAVGLQEVEEVPLKAEALANSLIGADYTIVLDVTPEELTVAEVQRRIDALLATPEIWRERERKGERYTYNLRPLVFELQVLTAQVMNAENAEDAKGAEGAKGAEKSEVEQLGPIALFLRVQQRNGATGRPDEVVAALGLDDFPRILRRERMYFEADAEDSALFARYPVVTKEEVAGQKLGKPRKFKPERVEAKGRTIAERAGDEFV